MPPKDSGTACRRLGNLADWVRLGTRDTRPRHGGPPGGPEAVKAGVCEVEGAEKDARGSGEDVSEAEEAQDHKEGS